MNDNWNIMTRHPNQPHFSPLWNEGMNEIEARLEFRARLRDSYYDLHNIEQQLVTDYSYHYEHYDTTRQDGTTRRRLKVIVDGWKAVTDG